MAFKTVGQISLSFRPAAKIENGLAYTIINDYLGTPVEAYGHLGDKVWTCELEAYDKVKKHTGDECFIPLLS